MTDPVSPAPPRIFDRELIARRLARRSGEPDFVTVLVLEDLADRLAVITRRFENALILGPDARFFPEIGRSAEGEFSFSRLSTLVGAGRIDPENLSLPVTDYDLIVSLLDLQAINDVPGFLDRLRRHLRPDGLFLSAAIGGASLGELRAAWVRADAEILGGAYARVAPFIEVRDAGMLLQRAGFALPVADVEAHAVRYETPLALMRELKTFGASNPLIDRPGKPVSKRLLAAACAAYEMLASDEDGRVRATLEFLWLSGWAPHESQQKPLAPGSAEVSLTKVLGSRDSGKA
jgi:SAM-dependent methyltransferase